MSESPFLLILIIVCAHERTYCCLFLVRAKDIEAQLLTACEEDLLILAEYEKAEENQEISSEQQ